MTKPTPRDIQLGDTPYSATSLGKPIAKPVVFVGNFGDGSRQFTADKYWRRNEIVHLRQWHGRVSFAELARSLNRTEVSVELKAKRLGLSSPVHWSNIWTTSTFAVALGQDRSLSCKQLKQGIYPVTTLYWGNEPMLAIYKRRFEQFVSNPLNWWLFFDMTRWVDPDLCAVRDRTAAAWGDKWLTTGEAGQLIGVGHGTVKRWIYEGLLPSSRKYANWRVLQSEILAVYHGKFGNAPTLGRYAKMKPSVRYIS